MLYRHGRGGARARDLDALRSEPCWDRRKALAMPRAGSPAVTDVTGHRALQAVAVAARAQQAARARRSQVLALCIEESGDIGASPTSSKRVMTTGDDKHVVRAFQAPGHLGLLESQRARPPESSGVDQVMELADAAGATSAHGAAGPVATQPAAAADGSAPASGYSALDAVGAQRRLT